LLLIEETLLKEKQRIEIMLNQYEERLLNLPKGSVTFSTVGDKKYYYLKHREGNKVVSQYVSFDRIEPLLTEIAERKHIEAMIKNLKKELRFANKALGSD